MPASMSQNHASTGMTDDLAWHAQTEAARCLSRHCCELLDVDETDAFDALTYVPESLLDLLHSPDGWGALVAIVASELGVTAPPFSPSIH